MPQKQEVASRKMSQQNDNKQLQLSCDNYRVDSAMHCHLTVMGKL